MIRIHPTELNFAAALSKVRRGPSQSTGPSNPLWFHHMSYTGGQHLRFTTTDSHISLSSRLPVTGEGDSWEGKVSQTNFDAFATVAGGGSFDLNPGSPKCILAEKLHQDDNGETYGFAYPFFCHPNPTPYPCGDLTGETEPTLIPRNPLRKALNFAVHSQSEKAKTSRLNTCTITTNGDVVAYSQKVFFRSTIVSLPFEVNILSADAWRLVNWLSLINMHPSTDIELTHGNDAQGRLCYQFRTADGAHSFRVIAVPRPVPTEFVGQIRREPAAIEGIVQGRALLELSGYFSQFRNSVLECRFVNESNQWHLQWATTGENPKGVGPLPFDDCKVRVPESPPTGFLVSPLALRNALTRYRKGSLHLSYQNSILVITDKQTVRGSDAPSGYQCFVRVTPVQELPGGGHDSSTVN